MEIEFGKDKEVLLGETIVVRRKKALIPCNESRTRKIREKMNCVK
jgi:hypothetical protein